MNLLPKSAGSKSLKSISGVPQMTAGFCGWGSTLLLVKITQQILNGLVQDIAHQIPFHGVVQPLSVKQISLKPEGERAWTWLQIHVQASSPVKLDVNDRIMYNDRKYKIMARLDYSANGYIEHHCVEDFQHGGG